jgi:hypothetical protein
VATSQRRRTGIWIQVLQAELRPLRPVEDRETARRQGAATRRYVGSGSRRTRGVHGEASAEVAKRCHSRCGGPLNPPHVPESRLRGRRLRPQSRLRHLHVHSLVKAALRRAAMCAGGYVCVYVLSSGVKPKVHACAGTDAHLPREDQPGAAIMSPDRPEEEGPNVYSGSYIPVTCWSCIPLFMRPCGRMPLSTKGSERTELAGLMCRGQARDEGRPRAYSRGRSKTQRVAV